MTVSAVVQVFFTAVVNFDMRAGFSLKEAAQILDIHPRRVTQSLDPTLERIAKLWRCDPTKTMESILDRLNRLPPMEADELDFLTRFQRGRVDPSELGQQPHDST